MSDYEEINYAEAWNCLSLGKEVFYTGFRSTLDPGWVKCGIGEDQVISTISGLIIPYSKELKLFRIERRQDYEILGLHNNWVEIDVFGLKAYQMIGDKCIYILWNDGRVFLSNGISIGAVDFIGSVVAERIRVTVNADKTIKMEKI